MDRLEKLLSICYSYKNDECDIQEFKIRLGTALLPEPETELAHRFEKVIDMHNVQAELELCIYAYGEEKGKEVADTLIEAINAILRN